MTWDELLEEFRALGGVADNVRLGNGEHGRGVFPIDPAQPVTIRIPRALMIPVSDTQLKGGELVVRPGAARKRETRFFDTYQREFGWSAAGREESLAIQRSWHELPQDVIDALKVMCSVDDVAQRFDSPTDENALQDYIRSRVFFFENQLRFIPVVEMVNHQATANEFVLTDSLAVEGVFAGEVVVSYHKLFDPISIAISWSFLDRPNYANSLGVSLEFEDGLELIIERANNRNKEVGNLVYPEATFTKNHARLSFMTLGNRADPAAPRKIFREVMRERMSGEEADAGFGDIAQYNTDQLQTLLALLEKYDTLRTRMLGAAVAHQLETIELSAKAEV